MLTVSKLFLRNHHIWNTSNKKYAVPNLPYLDFYWNYCDKKCLYLQNYLTDQHQY
jgi:hypothetical protein